ncbi:MULTISPECIES: YoaK family protein [unclassified Streptomyces]|uniref:YoaK family protein n=1 Tax=unclassified Streptomyces TaxID=2593676 RepID=UPI00352E4735
MPTPDAPSAPAGRATADEPRGHTALLLLSAASGAADAFVFICVGQVFAGVMTGNLVLLGASAAGAGEEGVAPRVVTALVSYGLGVAWGAVAGERVWRRLPVMLTAEVALLAAAAVLWGLGLVTSDADRLGLLALMGLAMGIQARLRATPTNYFTGTLTSLVGRLAVGSWRRGDGWVAGRLAAVVAGAAASALTVREWPDTGAVAAAALAAAALLIEAAPRRR